MQGENKMAVMPVSKLLVNMSIPLMISLLIQSLYNIADGIFVAYLSEDALTATSLAYPLQVIMITVSVGTAIGVNTELSRLIGMKDYVHASNIAVTGIILTVASSLVFVLVGIFFTDEIGRLLTDDENIAVLCGEYLHICMMLCSAIFLEMMFQRFLQATGKTFLSMISLVMGAVTNIVLDPILIFGYFGFDAMGVKGAAIATVIGQWVGAIVACLLNTFLNKEVKLTLKDYKMSGALASKIYKVGLPTMVTNGLPSVMVAVMNAILMPVSSTAVAFFGIYYKLQNFLLMPINGLGQACLPIISFNIGTGDMKRVKQVFKYSIPATIIIALVATVIFLVFPKQLLLLFSASDAMLAIGVNGLRIISVTFVFASVTVVLGYAMSGLGNGVILMIATLIRQLVILVPVSYLLLEFCGLDYVWFAFLPAEIVALIFIVIASYKTYNKTKMRLKIEG